MNPNDTKPVQTQTAFDTSEVRKASFWIAQLCIIIATVLGVYLAANQGFKQALAYGEIQSDKANCYLRMSLRTEMANNVTIVKEYVARIRQNETWSARKAPLLLQDYVWQNMRVSANTLETPSELLNANIEFLRDIDAAYKVLSVSGDVAGPSLDKMDATIAKLEKEIFPKFDTNINELKTRLKKQDVEI